MTLIGSIYTPQESVNDDFLSVISIAVKSGQFVTKNSLIAELETSKALLEVRSELEGYVKVFLTENTDVRVGELMFEFYDGPFVESAKDLVQHNKVVSSNEATATNSKFSNAALDYIEKNKIDPNKYKSLAFVTTKDLTGGDLGRIIKENTTTLIKTKESNAAEKTIKPISKTKRSEFDFLFSVNSSSVISRLSTNIQIGALEVIGEAQQFIKSTPLPSVIQEVSKLLLKYPNLNSFYLNGDQAFYNEVNIGFAIDDGRNGLKVAAIFNTNDLSLTAVEENVSDLSLKYANNQLTIQELTSATFTITDLFNTEIIGFHPLVNSNNSGILGISSYRNGEFNIDLSFDHRVTNGKEVSGFLSDLKYRLESRFKSNNYLSNIELRCLKCFRDVTDDLNGEIYFQRVINSKFKGYICSNCLTRW